VAAVVVVASADLPAIKKIFKPAIPNGEGGNNSG
jgi:hypothetical protein